jgi:hypothetical protein
VRSIWADLDNTPASEASRAWANILPSPTLIVASSTRGTHAYWRLEQPLDVSLPGQRLRFESFLAALYEEIGADTTQDVSRMLRLPGTVNWRSYHEHGRAPEPCRITEFRDVAYPITELPGWNEAQAMSEEPVFANPAPPTVEISLEARQLLQALDRNTGDRSRRDFAIICSLLRCGIHDDQVLWNLVREKSKFKDRGWDYFSRTLENAKKALGDEDSLSDLRMPRGGRV